MDFPQLIERTKKIQQSADELIGNYNNIIDGLSIIYDILASKIGNAQLRNLNDLINDYIGLAQETNNTYGEGADGIIRYVNRTQANLDLLTSNLKATLNMLNTAVDSLQL